MDYFRANVFLTMSQRLYRFSIHHILVDSWALLQRPVHLQVNEVQSTTHAVPKIKYLDHWQFREIQLTVATELISTLTKHSLICWKSHVIGSTISTCLSFSCLWGKYSIRWIMDIVQMGWNTEIPEIREESREWCIDRYTKAPFGDKLLHIILGICVEWTNRKIFSWINL